MEFGIPPWGIRWAKGEKLANLAITFDSLYILIHVRET